MLKCRDLAREASDYIEHSMPWHRRWRLAFHLFICINCRRFLRHLRITRRLARLRHNEPASAQEIQQVVDHVCKHH